MRRTTWCAVAVLAALMGSAARADVILTADGETISGYEATIVDGLVQVPGTDQAASRRWSLADLQRINFAAARPTGELKTRFVRIELPGENKLLHVAEVQVFEGDENIALKGQAKQSSLYKDSNEDVWGPQKAIDGQTDGDSHTAGTTHTNMENTPWWEVDLGRDAAIKKVVVWNRTDDNVGDRIAGFRVVLLDEKRSMIWTRTFPAAPTPSVEMDIPARGDAFTETDLQAFDAYSGTTASTGVLNSLVSWLSGSRPAAKADASAPPSDFPAGAHLVLLTNGGRLTGTPQKWTEEGLTLTCSVGPQNTVQTIPSAMIRELVSKEVAEGTSTIDRSQVAADQDTVFATVEGGAIQAVTGKVKGLDGGTLLFEYKGQERRINFGKVVAIVRHPPEQPQSTPFALVELRGGHKLPGMLVSLSEGQAVIETLWAGRVEVPRTALVEMVVRNGRVTSLTDLEPAAAKHIPFLDRAQPHSVNKSLSGGPLQVAQVKFDRGLCTHSKTMLTYDLTAGYSRLRSQVGLQKGDGDNGRALVRVVSDGTVLYEKQLSGGEPPETIDLDTSGKKSLTLEVDYGDNLDIGDHVVWGDPVLIRPAAP